MRLGHVIKFQDVGHPSVVARGTLAFIGGQRRADTKELAI